MGSSSPLRLGVRIVYLLLIASPALAGTQVYAFVEVNIASGDGLPRDRSVVAARPSLQAGNTPTPKAAARGAHALAFDPIESQDTKTLVGPSVAAPERPVDASCAGDSHVPPFAVPSR